MQEKPGECDNNGCENSNPENIAKYFKFFSSMIETDGSKTSSRIFFKKEYSDNRDTYDRLFSLGNRLGMNLREYVRYCVIERHVSSCGEMLSRKNIMGYVGFLREGYEQRRIFNHFLESANYVAERCIEGNQTPTEYISDLVNNNTLAYEYYYGNISGHFLASIQNFKELYSRLDYMNRSELSIIDDATDYMNQTLQDAFMKFRGVYVRPIGFTESIIKQKQKHIK